MRLRGGMFHFSSGRADLKCVSTVDDDCLTTALELLSRRGQMYQKRQSDPLATTAEHGVIKLFITTSNDAFKGWGTAKIEKSMSLKQTWEYLLRKMELDPSKCSHFVLCQPPFTDDRHLTSECVDWNQSLSQLKLGPEAELLIQMK